MTEKQESVSITFKTSLPAPYELTEDSRGPYIIPVSMDRVELSSFLTDLLETDKQFDFRVNGSLLRGTLRSYLESTEDGTELTLDLEYFLLWDAHEPESVDKTPSPIVDMIKVSTSASSAFVLVLCSGGQIVSYPLSAGEVDREQASHTSVASEEPLCFIVPPSADYKTRIRVATVSGLLFEFDVAKLTQPPVLVGRVTAIPDAISSAAVSPDGTKYAFGTVTGGVYISTQKEIFVDSISKKRKKPVSTEDMTLTIAHSFPDAHRGAVMSLAFLETSQREFYLLSAGEDAAIRVWDHIEGTKVHGFDATDAVTYMHVKRTADTITAVTGHFDGRVRVWGINIGPEAAYMSLKKTFPAHSRSVLRCAYNSYEDSQETIISTGNDQAISVIDILANQVPLTLQTVPSGNVQRPEYPALPSAALWIEKRLCLVGTTHNDLLKYRFD